MYRALGGPSEDSFNVSIIVRFPERMLQRNSQARTTVPHAYVVGTARAILQNIKEQAPFQTDKHFVLALNFHDVYRSSKTTRSNFFQPLDGESTLATARHIHDLVKNTNRKQEPVP